jgi:hypothetical protein
VPAGPVVDPPVLVAWPCSGGWAEQSFSSGDLTYQTCTTPAALSCGGIQVPRVSGGCGFIGGACDGSQPFPPDIPDAPGGVLFVAPGGTGPGTRDAPFGSVQQALDASAPDSVVALSLGTYNERLVLPAWNVTLLGACAGATLLKNPSPGALAVIVAGGADHTVRNLTVLAGDASDGLMASGAGRVVLDGVLVSDAQLFGLRLDGPAVELTDVKVEGDSGSGVGLTILSGSQVTANRLVITQSRRVGIDVAPSGVAPTVLAGSDIWILNTRASQSAGGYGLRVSQPGRVDLQRVVVAATEGVGVKGERGGQLSITDLIVRDTAIGSFSAVDGTALSGQGLVVSDAGTRAVVTRALLERSHLAGAYAANQGELELSDLVVSDTSASPERIQGHGLVVQTGGRATVSRVLLTGNAGAGVLGAFKSEGNSLLSLFDIVDAVIDGSGGDGVAVLDGALGNLGRARVTGNGGAGVAAYGGVITLRSSDVECHADGLDLAYDSASTIPPAQQGTNRCGCEHRITSCQPLAADLVDPLPLSQGLNP